MIGLSLKDITIILLLFLLDKTVFALGLSPLVSFPNSESGGVKCDDGELL